MIKGWEKGPRDRSKKSFNTWESADWVSRIGPHLAVEVMDLPNSADPKIGVCYADLVLGEGPSQHRIRLGPILYGSESMCDVQTEADLGEALRIHDRRGRAAATLMLETLRGAL